MGLIHEPRTAGADEAGRGPLAGPVVCAAVILPDDFDCSGLNDSKQLTAIQRDELALRIRASADIAIVRVEPEEIDRLNILWASMEGMSRAVHALRGPVTRVLIDGNRIPPGLQQSDGIVAVEAIVKGDGKFACIAAASILAKTERDRIMTDYALEFPQYGFDGHFGYPTPEHLSALRNHGPCPIHRRSFRPVAELDQGSLF